jgi:hypothetical protein
MVGEHVPDCASAFSLETTKQIVELKGAGEQTKHLLLDGFILDLKDGSQKKAKA